MSPMKFVFASLMAAGCLLPPLAWSLGARLPSPTTIDEARTLDDAQVQERLDQARAAASDQATLQKGLADERRRELDAEVTRTKAVLDRGQERVAQDIRERVGPKSAWDRFVDVLEDLLPGPVGTLFGVGKNTTQDGTTVLTGKALAKATKDYTAASDAQNESVVQSDAELMANDPQYQAAVAGAASANQIADVMATVKVERQAAKDAQAAAERKAAAAQEQARHDHNSEAGRDPSVAFDRMRANEGRSASGERTTDHTHEGGVDIGELGPPR